MSKRTIVFCLGVFVALLPFLGFPQSWDTLLFVTAGILLSTIVWVPIRHSPWQRTVRDVTPTVEHNPVFAEHRPDEPIAREAVSAQPPMQRTARIRTPRLVKTSNVAIISSPAPRKRQPKRTASADVPSNLPDQSTS